MSTSIGHMRSSCICTRKASWGEQGPHSRRVHTTLLRAELPGRIGIGDHAILGIILWRARKPLLITDLWLTRQYRLWYRGSLSMDCKYGLWWIASMGGYSNMEASIDLVQGSPSAAPLIFFLFWVVRGKQLQSEDLFFWCDSAFASSQPFYVWWEMTYSSLLARVFGPETELIAILDIVFPTIPWNASAFCKFLRPTLVLPILVHIDVHHALLQRCRTVNLFQLFQVLIFKGKGYF